jgi:hypothetical protein
MEMEMEKRCSPAALREFKLRSGCLFERKPTPRLLGGVAALVRALET